MTSSSRRRFSPRNTLVLAALGLARTSTCVLGSTRLTECPAGSQEATYSWDGSEGYLYVEGAGSCVTLSDIYKNAPDTPLVPVDEAGEEAATETGIWLLTKGLSMESGTTLLLHDDLGCDELRLLSSSKNPTHLRGNGAYISLLRTKVFSWSRSKAAYDTGASDGSNPRAYMSVLSEVTHASDTCDGAADDDVGEGRLDIINSEVGYLGFQGPEAYGITFKVRGFCKDESNPEVFDRVNVRGDIRFSDIHHNWFGMYSYGHQDGNWEYNLMHDCGSYGFDPHDDSDNLRIHNNIVYKNGNHGIIASKRCNDVSIQNNEVYDNKLHGIMLHRSSDNGIIRNNTVTNSGDACIALFESFDIEVSNNVCDGNAQGIRLSMGSSNNKMFDNQVLNTLERAYYIYSGSDPIVASEATNGRCTNNLFQENYIDSAAWGVHLKDSRSNKIIGNTFIDTADMEMEWDDSDGVLWKDNEVTGVFAMNIEKTCIESGSDLDQIESAGGRVKECT